MDREGHTNRTVVVGVQHWHTSRSNATTPDNLAVVSDLFYLLRGTSPEDRAMLRRRSHRDGAYWEFLPAIR
jgi:hypothetical protein